MANKDSSKVVLPLLLGAGGIVGAIVLLRKKAGPAPAPPQPGPQLAVVGNATIS